VGDGVNVGVVVTTCQEHKHSWLLDCLESLKDVPTLIHWNDADRNYFEAGGIEPGYIFFDRFWLIPDTVVVKNLDLMYYYLNSKGNEFCLGPNFISCIGVLTKEGIARMNGIPTMPTNKHEAVDIELAWFSRYAQMNRCEVIDPGFFDGPIREWRNGRLNMVLDSPILTKYKGTWDRSMIR
jgi:hypothetical protein